MNDEQFQAWLAKHGGEVGRKNNEKESATGPTSPDTGLPSKVTVVDSTTITAKDGATITLRRPSGAAGTGESSAYEQVAETPPLPRASSDESVSAPSNQPQIATRQPDGTIKWVPNQNYQPPAPAPRTPEQQATDAATAQTAQALNNERQWNSQHGYGWVTHDQRAETVRAEQAQARADQSVARQTAATEAANQLARDRLQFDREKANLPDVKATPLDRNGQRYWQVATTTPQGQTKFTNYGPDGKPIDRIPSEGEATSGGPSMPEIFLGHSEQAIRAYHAALNADKSLTSAQREKRFAEFIQTATIAQNEAQTLQRERESQRNADYNTAATKLNFLESSQDSALKFVADLNGKIKPGSSAGADAFVALMGLQLLNLKMSGINNLKSAGSYTDAQRSLPTAAQLAYSDPTKLAEQRQAIGNQVAEQAATPAVSLAPPQQNAGAGAGEPPSRGALPGQSPVPAATTPSAPQPGAAPAAPASAVPAASPMPEIAGPASELAIPTQPPAINGATGEPTGLAPLPENGQFPPQSPLMKPDDSPIWSPAEPIQPTAPDYGQPGMHILPPPPSETVPPLPPGEVLQAPAPLPPALAALLPPPPPAQPLMGQQADASQSPALLHVQAASKPIWAMTEAEVEAYRRAGVPEDVIMGIPGRSTAA